jgi:hypothetical protein
MHADPSHQNFVCDDRKNSLWFWEGLRERDPLFCIGSGVWMWKAVSQIHPDLTVVGMPKQVLCVIGHKRTQRESRQVQNHWF